MKLSMLISKLMEQQDPNQSLSTLQSVLDLLSDEERKELATFIQQNLANISPEKVRQEKQAAATAAVRAGMTPGTPKAKVAPPPSPQQTRQEKQAAAAAAARASMTPAPAKIRKPEDVLTPSSLEFWKKVSQDPKALQLILKTTQKDPSSADFLIKDQEFWKQIITDQEFWDQLMMISKNPPSEPVSTSNFSQGGYGDATTNVSQGIPSVPRDPLARLRSTPKDTAPRATPDFSRSKYGSVKTNVPAGIPSVPKVPTAAKSAPKTTKKRSSSKKRNT